jgi:hypothetical protein
MIGMAGRDKEMTAQNDSANKGKTFPDNVRTF